jgi:hypothetical protein
LELVQTATGGATSDQIAGALASAIMRAGWDKLGAMVAGFHIAKALKYTE